jgi:hypothetical protein
MNAAQPQAYTANESKFHSLIDDPRSLVMQDAAVVSVVPGLSEAERIVDTFVAPSKTFTDILRSASWWAPFVFILLVGVVFNIAVDKKVGFDQVSQQQIEKNHFAADRINALPPDQKAAQLQASAARTRGMTYGSGVIILVFGVIVSLLWWASLNFVLGAETKFSQVLAVWMYAGLPKAFVYLIAAGLLFGGVGIDGFDIQNPAGTNPGYYMTDSSAALKIALGFFDVFGLWALALAVLGCAIIARKTISQAALVVVGWWLFGMVLIAGVTAAFS